MSDEIPSDNRRPPTCPDCGCHPHRHADPNRDKDCLRCGCPNLRDAKRERDAGLMSAHGDPNRPSEGFY